MSALDLDVEENRSLDGEQGGLIYRRGSRATFRAAKRFKCGSVEVKADDVVDAFVEVAIEGGVFGEGNKLGRGDLGGRSKDRVSSNYV